MATPSGERRDPGDPGWTLRLLGSVVKLERSGVEVVPELRTAVLLVLLAVDGPLPRERAAALLWPDRPQQRARANLRQLLYRLRQDADVVVGDPLALSTGVAVDVTSSGVGQPLGSGESILDGYDVQTLGEAADRFAAARSRVVALVREDLVARIERAERAGDVSAAAAAATSLADLDPADEGAVQRAMRLLLAQGKPSRALHLFARAKDALRRLLDVAPGEAMVALAQRAAEQSARPLDSALADPAGALAHTRETSPYRSDRLVRRAETRGWMAEGASLLREQASTKQPGPDRARLLAQVAWLDHQAGRHDAAEAAANTALTDLSPEDDDATRIEVCFVLGSLARHRGDLDAATQWWDRALERAARRTQGGDALTLRLNLGLVADALGRTDEALQHYLKALPLAKTQANTGTLALLWNNLGHVLLGRGQTADAESLLTKAADSAARSGDRRLRAYALEGLARCAKAGGNAARARALAADALATANESGDPVLRVEAALSVAEADAEEGERERGLATARAALSVARRHANVPGAIRAAAVMAAILGPANATARRVTELLADQARGADRQHTWDELFEELVTTQ